MRPNHIYTPYKIINFETAARDLQKAHYWLCQIPADYIVTGNSELNILSRMSAMVDSDAKYP